MAERFFLFRFVLAMLTDKDVVFPKIITLQDLKKEFDFLKQKITDDCLIRLMGEVTRCCKGWGTVMLSEEFWVIWEFKEPTFKQMALTVWKMSTGDENKYVPMEYVSEIAVDPEQING